MLTAFQIGFMVGDMPFYKEYREALCGYLPGNNGIYPFIWGMKENGVECNFRFQYGLISRMELDDVK